jgi:hypothetical protein
MRRDFHCKRRDKRALIAALLSLALATAGCTNSNIGVGTLSPAATGGTSATTSATPAAPPPASPASSPSFKDKMESFFSGATQREPQPVANAQPDVDCPFIDIRQGASTLTIPPPPADGSNEAMSLKYQGIFVRAARECKVASGQMMIKLGVEGRIIVGPAGGPGQVDVPLRIALVDVDPAGAKTIVTKLIRIPVMVGNDDNVNFTHIEDDLSFPLPPSAKLDDYVIYIGFDPLGAAAEDKAKLKPVAKPKLKLKPNPAAPTG